MATDYNEQNVINAHQIDPHQGHLLLHQILKYKGFRQIGKADVLLYPNNLKEQDSVAPSRKWIITCDTV
jgi:hypothetical protein